jgi:hypothetical protein
MVGQAQPGLPNKDVGFVRPGQLAEIKTGRRTVISYMLDPVLRYRDESFGMR